MNEEELRCTAICGPEGKIAKADSREAGKSKVVAVVERPLFTVEEGRTESEISNNKCSEWEIKQRTQAESVLLRKGRDAVAAAANGSESRHVWL
tara:strand:- start:102 stop:383 length:282 start_codon:yes stop_codon:yes gene_type:complete